MIKVFIGGSRKIANLPTSAVARIDNIINADFAILVGDAPGVDKSVQRYLAERRYENVIVFHSGDRCRNNIGNWVTRRVQARSDQRGGEFYALKDLAMAAEANYGLMIWDRKSRGTLNNIRNLLKAGKKVLVFLAPDQSFYRVRSAADISTLLP